VEGWQILIFAPQFVTLGCSLARIQKEIDFEKAITGRRRKKLGRTRRAHAFIAAWSE